MTKEIKNHSPQTKPYEVAYLPTDVSATQKLRAGKDKTADTFKLKEKGE